MTMKWRIYIFWIFVAGATRPLAAAPIDTNTSPRSVFILPTNPNEGRDPFYPNSLRPYQDFAPKRAVDLTALQIKGFSVIAGHRYVIINNHTFGEGDEGDVITPGGRVHIRCLTLGTDTVLVESNGSRHLLRFYGQP
jgi:hypothetical protein